MIAKERGYNVRGALVALTLMGAFGADSALAQSDAGARGGRKPVTNPGATAWSWVEPANQDGPSIASRAVAPSSKNSARQV